MPNLDHLRSEIERMRTQVHRQRGVIRQLQRAGVSTASAEALLERMLTKIDGMSNQRESPWRSELGLMAEIAHLHLRSSGI
jgi:phage shock protein A